MASCSEFSPLVKEDAVGPSWSPSLLHYQMNLLKHPGTMSPAHVLPRPESLLLELMQWPGPGRSSQSVFMGRADYKALTGPAAQFPVSPRFATRIHPDTLGLSPPQHLHPCHSPLPGTLLTTPCALLPSRSCLLTL